MTRRSRPSRPTRTDQGGHPDVEVRIEKVVAEGDGLARLPDGRVVFVEGGLPGEMVRARIVRQSRDYARAVAVEILEAHDQRVEPPCPFVRSGCGGCDLQHATLALQQQIKHDIVVESLVRLGKISEPEVRSTDASVIGEGDPTAHPLRDGDESGLGPRAKRTTVRVVGDAEGRPGFRRRGSHDVVAIDSCLVAHDGVNEMLRGLRLDPDREAVLRVGVSSGEQIIWADPSTRLAGQLAGDLSRGETPATGPTAVTHERVAGVDFLVSASSFFQSSPAAAEDLVTAVRIALGDPSTWPPGFIVDAYGGVGLFTATVIPADREAILIEVSASSCRDATANLGHRPVRIVQTPLESWAPEPAAVVIADPPRDGLRAGGVDIVAATGAAIVVLVSCDPASLGRDARLLEDAGYRFVHTQVVGAFPHTHHVETVSRFDKVKWVENQ